MDNEKLIESVYSIIEQEINRARNIHPPMVGEDHAAGVIMEEIGEFFESIQKQSVNPFELAQVAGCCVMAIKDLYPSYKVSWMPNSDLEIAKHLTTDRINNRPEKMVVTYHSVYARLYRSLNGYINGATMQFGQHLPPYHISFLIRAFEYCVDGLVKLVEELDSKSIKLPAFQKWSVQ